MSKGLMWAFLVAKPESRLKAFTADRDFSTHFQAKIILFVPCPGPGLVGEKGKLV
jgi:hypothetical protein